MNSMFRALLALAVALAGCDSRQDWTANDLAPAARPFALSAPASAPARPGETVVLDLAVTCPANWPLGFTIVPGVEVTPSSAASVASGPDFAFCPGHEPSAIGVSARVAIAVAADAPPGPVTVTFSAYAEGHSETSQTVIEVVAVGAPAMPAGLSAAPQTRSVQLSWTADATVHGWRLERSSAGAPLEAVALVPAGSTGHEDSGLLPDTAYSYRLVPHNAAGDGPAAIVHTRTLAEPAGSGTLSAAILGDGSGRVRSDPAGIDCPGDCTENWPQGTVVRLVPEPAIGSTFQGWSGAADCADGLVTVVLEMACTATFARAPTGARGWVDMGTALVSSFGESPVVAADPAGPVYVALRHVTGNGFRELLVHRFDGSGWSVVGNAPLNGIGLVGSHGLVVDDQGRPVVAWTEPGAVRVMRFERGLWNLLADNLRVGTGTAAQVQLEMRNGALVAAWFEIEAGTYRLVLKAFDGAAWRGGFGLDEPDMRAFRLALDAQGTPAVVVSRRPSAVQQPLVAWRADVVEAQSVQWSALGGRIEVTAGQSYLHEQIGFGIGFLPGIGSPGAPVVYGTRDDRYAYAKGLSGANWIAVGRRNGVADADGVLADVVPGSGERLAQAMPMRTSGPAVMLHVAPLSPLQPRRIELSTLSGNDWVNAADALVVPQLTSAASATIDATGAPVVVTVEGFGAGGSGRVRAYRWVQ